MSNLPNKDKHYSISKAAQELQITPQLLRQWETRAEFIPSRNERGHRYYTGEDIQFLKDFKSKINKRSYVTKNQEILEIKKRIEHKLHRDFEATRRVDLFKKVLKFSTLGLVVTSFALFVIMGMTSATFAQKYMNKTALLGMFGLGDSGEAMDSKIANVLGERDQEADFLFSINVPTNIGSDLTVTGDAIFEGDISTPGVNLLGTGTLAGVATIDIATQATLEGTLAVGGDLEGTLATALISNGVLDGTEFADFVTLDGDLDVTGEIQADGDAGSDGQVLTSTGSGVEWLDLDSVDAETLDGVDSTGFLRSDTSDNYTSGTLAFSDATFLDLSLITHNDVAVQGFKLPQAASLVAPTTGEGFLAYDTDDDKILIYNGSSWTDVSGASTTLQQAYAAGEAIQLSATNGDFRISNDSSMEMFFADESTGRIGIGDISPLFKLDVTGTFGVSGAVTLASNLSAAGTIDFDGLTSSTSENTIVVQNPSGELLAREFSDFVEDDLIAVGEGAQYFLPKWTGSRTLTDSSIYDNGTNVGIGTSSPSYKLHVIGRAEFEGDVLMDDQLYMTTSTLETLYHSQNQLFINRLESANDVIISGLVGIGNTNPSYKLDVNGDVRIASGSELYSYGSATLGNRTYTDDRYVTDDQTFTASIDALDQQIYGVVAGESGIWLDRGTYIEPSTSTGNFSISDAGNVGIGTTSPGASLHVSGGNVFLENQLYASTIYPYSGALNLGDKVFIKSGNVGIGSTTPSSLLSVGASNQFTIDSSGDITKINNVAYSFPSSQAGASNYVLSNDGSGNLSWASVTGDGGLGALDGTGTANYLPLWSDANTLTSSSLYETGGQIGIGTTTPSYKLDIIDSTALVQRLQSTSGNSTLIIDATNQASLTFAETGIAKWNFQMASSIFTDGLQVWNSTEGVKFAMEDGANGDIVMNWGGGNVGIGTTSPAFLLDVAGTFGASGAVDLDGLPSDSSEDSIVVQLADGTLSYREFSDFTADDGITDGVGTANYIPIWSDANTIGLSSIYETGGKVGIGTTAPGDLVNIKEGSLLIGDRTSGVEGGTQLNDHTMVDLSTPFLTNYYNATGFINFYASNNATLNNWNRGLVIQSVTTGRSITLASDNIRFMDGSSSGIVYADFDSSGNFGIGSTTPAARLHIMGSADDEQLIVQANATQTANIQEWQTSNGSVVANVDPYGGLYISKSGDRTTSGSNDGLRIFLTANPTGDSSSTYQGISSQAFLTGNDNFTGTSIGVKSTIQNGKFGGITDDIRAFSGGLIVNGAATTTDGYGLYINTPAISGGGTLTNSYGIYLEDHNTGGTLNYALYTNAGLNRLGDQLSIVGSQDVVQNIIKANGTQTANIVEIQNSSGTVLGGRDNEGRVLSYARTGSATNFFAGLGAGKATSSGLYNNAIGYQTLFALTSGSYNNALGEGVLYSNQTGSYNNAIGQRALRSNTTGWYNNAYGFQALYYSQTGTGNLGLGYRSGGYGTGATFTGADYNTVIGHEAGYNLGQDDDKNVYIGYQAGYSETGSNKLYLASGNNTALIYGDFSTGTVGIGGTAAHTNPFVYVGTDGSVGIGTTNPNYNLQVANSIGLGEFEAGVKGALIIDPTTGHMNSLSSPFMAGKYNNANIFSMYWSQNNSGDYLAGMLIDTSLTANRGLNIKVSTDFRIFTDGGNHVFDDNGNVGIGTLTPGTAGLAVMSGNVGIGTTSPLSQLHINGGIGTLSTGLAFGDGDTGFWEESDDTLNITTAGATRFKFVSTYLISATASGGSLNGAASSATVPGLTFRDDYNTGVGRAGTDIVSLIAGGTNGLNVISSGNVGIGTTSPSQELEVAGDILLTGTIALNGASIDATNGINIAMSADSGTTYGTVTSLDMSAATTITGHYVTDGSISAGNGIFGFSAVFNNTTAEKTAYDAVIYNGDGTAYAASASTGGTGYGISAGATDAYGFVSLVGTTNDGVTDNAYSYLSKLVTYAGASDVGYGLQVVDNLGLSSGGTQYGVYVDLDDTDVTNWALYTVDAGGDSYLGDDLFIGGNLGIGTTTPYNALSVIGNVSMGSRSETSTAYKMTNFGVAAKTTTTDNLNMLLLSSEALVDDPLSMVVSLVGNSTGASRYGYLQVGEYSTGNYRNLALNPSGGNVGIGTTAPAYAFDVIASGTGIIARFNSANSSGCTLADGGTISCTSDEKLKTSITTLESSALGQVLGLNPVTFDWKSGDTGEENLGFIAQDVELIVPQLVSVDAATGYKQLNTIGIIPLLTKAIQEQQTQIEALQALVGGEVTESTESTSSTSLATLEGTALYESMLTIFNEFKDFVEALGLSKQVDEDGNEILAVSSDMNVTGTTTLADVKITGNLTAGLIEIDSLNNEVNVLGASCYNSAIDSHNKELCDSQTLYIQKAQAGNLDILGGIVVIEPNGKMTLKGTLEVEQLAITTVDNPSAGSIIIEAGETSLTINTNKVKESSLILVTPRTPVVIGTSFVEEGIFEIKISTALEIDLQVDWLLVGTN